MRLLCFRALHKGKRRISMQDLKFPQKSLDTSHTSELFYNRVSILRLTSQRFSSISRVMIDLTSNSVVSLNNGREIPAIGLGVYRAAPGESTESAVEAALKLGYRHIDTAHIYGNEADVGAAIAKSGIPRHEIFVTTKLWDADQGYDSALQACEESLQKLGLDYIDLYLIHSPNPGPKLRKESWDALQHLVTKDKVKSIGVSNYGINHLKELLGSNPNIRPVVNQLEIHPWNTRTELVEFCKDQSIEIEAYSPLTKGRKLDDPVLVKIASKYEKSPAQVLIRWSLQHGYIVLPKSVTPERISSNLNVFDFDLSHSDMQALDEKDEYLLTGWDPTVVP